MQSLGYSSAKLAQGTCSELENEAEEKDREGERESEGGDVGRARGISESQARPGKERSSRSRLRRETLGSRTGGPGKGRRERDGWMGRQRRFQ